ncbi:NUDIX domain-containing protein [Streptosporangium soli]
MAEKLVRDKIPDVYPGNTYRQAAPDERAGLLRAKLAEETNEYLTSRHPGELADILEVLHALARLHDLDPAGLELLREAKSAERGALTQGIVLQNLPVRHSVRAVLLDGDDLVLFRRVRAGREPYWITPGGQVESGDDGLEAALRRELDEELGATTGPALPLITLDAPGARYSVFACRLHSLDLSRRSGPEFDDPANGTHEIQRVPFTPEGLRGVHLVPIELADYLSMNTDTIPALLETFTSGGRYRPVVDVHVLLLDPAGRVLLGRRENTGYADGEWQIMPSGHLEEGESVVDTAIREAREELGVDLVDLEPTNVVHHRNPGGTARIGIFFTSRKWRGNPVNAEPHKCAELAWHPLDDLPPGTIPYAAAGIRATGLPLSLHGWATPAPTDLAAEATRAGYQEMTVTVLGHHKDTLLIHSTPETDHLPTTLVRHGESLTAAAARIVPGDPVFVRADDYISPTGLPARRFVFTVECDASTPVPDGVHLLPADSPLRLTTTDQRIIADTRMQRAAPDRVRTGRTR